MKIVNKILIDAPPEEVFAWLEDSERAKQWAVTVKSSEIIHETPERVGTTFREYIEEDGRGIEMLGVLTEFVVGKRFGVRLESRLNVVHVCFILAPEDGRTRLTQDVDLRFKGLLKLLTPFVRRSVRRKITSQTQREFGRLKQLCERSG